MRTCLCRFVSAAFRLHTKVNLFVLLTSTCIQMLYFLQMSEMAMRGSNAPYTVVPAVALTKKGTKPCKSTNAKSCTQSNYWCNNANMFWYVFNRLNSIKSVYYSISSHKYVLHYLLLRLQYSPLKVSWDKFTTAKQEQALVSVCEFLRGGLFSIQIKVPTQQCEHTPLHVEVLHSKSYL